MNERTEDGAVQDDAEVGKVAMCVLYLNKTF